MISSQGSARRSGRRVELISGANQRPNQKGERKMRQCVDREMGADWGGAVQTFPVEWHNL